ncbi:MAG: UDP-N-acetylmuramoyl-tripeptide--D-alanyl-D-alan ine ligase [Frankiales bacterium]|nr:UDP-N-acetylmuramoyl-tripeptide--D-alanyl-D-alan ine ligase [Frankiales bacterium]
MTLLIQLLCLATAVAGAPRWLRVAQREHYLPGSVSWTDQLWLSRSRLSALVWVPVVGFFALGLLVNPWFYLACAVLAQLTPFGLPYRGRTSRLAWTPRVRRLAIVLAILLLLVAAWSPALAACASVFLTALVDVALFVVGPVEQRLSKTFLEQARDKVGRVRPIVIAITGSYGKTTTKNYLAHLLSQTHTVLASPASFNNAMGLSRAVNEGLVPGTEVFVAEMATYGEGEIRALCEVFPPDIAVLTAIGEVHLQRMKTREGVLRAKSEITVKARTVVVNNDDPLLAGLADSLVQQGKEVVRCSVTDVAADVAIVAGRLTVRGADLGAVSLPDSVHPSNAAVAVGAAVALGDEPKPLINRLKDLPAVAHRLEPMSLPDGSWILDDTYNSNPAGAAEAVRRASVLASRSGGKVHVVTPGMVELGAVQAERNEELGRAVVSAGAATLVVVGRTNATALRKGAAGGSTEIVELPTRPEAVAFIEKRSAAGDVVLFENDLPDHYP